MRRKALVSLFRTTVLSAGLFTLPIAAWAGYFEPDKTGTAGGVVIHKAICASCHGYDGAGNYPSFVNEQLTPRLQGRSVGRIAVIARGGEEPGMPGFSEAELSDREISELGTYAEVTLPSTGPTHDPCKPGFPANPANNTSPNPVCAATVNIIDEDPWFEPYVLALPGPLPKTVAFINSGQTWHTVTQGDFLLKAVDKPPTFTSDQWNSGLIGRGGRVFHTFTTSGESEFYCMLHPFMSMKVCAGSTSCSAPTPGSPLSTKGLPPAGVGELWVAVQMADVPNKAPDKGVGSVSDPRNPARAPFPDLDLTFDDRVKDGELQVINLTNYTKRRVPDPNVINPATGYNYNPFNNPHYIWARGASLNGAPLTRNPEMVINNYLDNYLTMVDANSTTAASQIIIPELVWGATTSHTTSKFDGSMLYAPVQGDWAIQELNPSVRNNTVGDWRVGNLLRFDSRDQHGRIGSMPHGIWAGGTNGSLIQVANSRSNNTTIYDIPRRRYSTCSATTEGFPLNAGITATAGLTGGAVAGESQAARGIFAANTNVGNPFTPTTSITLNLVELLNAGTSQETLQCGGSRFDIPLPGKAAVQSPPSPNDRFWAISNGPYISFVDRYMNFPAGSACTGGTFASSPSGFRVCNIDVNSHGAHGVSWAPRPGNGGYRVYMAGKFVDFVAVADLAYTTPDQIRGPVTISHIGDIPLTSYTTNKRAYPGYTNTGGQGVTTNPLPAPWR